MFEPTTWSGIRFCDQVGHSNSLVPVTDHSLNQLKVHDCLKLISVYLSYINMFKNDHKSKYLYPEKLE